MKGCEILHPDSWNVSKVKIDGKLSGFRIIMLKDIKTLPAWNSKFGMQDVAPCILNWLVKVDFHKLKV